MLLNFIILIPKPFKNNHRKRNATVFNLAHDGLAVVKIHQLPAQ